MTQVSRRHHYIPKFWIKRWANDEGLVERYRKHSDGSLDVLLRPPKSVGYWQDLYKLPEGLPQDVSLEDLFFKKVDDHASKLFHRLLEYGDVQLTGQEAGTLAVFVLSLLHRTPKGFHAVIDASEKMFNEIDDELSQRYSEIRGENDPPTYEEYRSREGDGAARRTFFRNFPKMILSENMVEFIGRLHWHRLTRPSNCHELLLSDDPLIRTNGLKKKDGHIAFPLSPDHLLAGFYDSNFASEVLSSPPREIFREANLQAAASANDFVVSRRRNQTRFIENHFGSRPRPSLAEQMMRNRQDDIA